MSEAQIKTQKRLIWLAVVLAVFTALAYVLIALHILPVGDLDLAKEGGIIIFVAAGCYLLGGLLILVGRKWLWAIGALINLMVMLFFFNMYSGRPAVMFSAGGLVTKGTQLLLEIGLIVLLFPKMHSPAAHA